MKWLAASVLTLLFVLLCVNGVRFSYQYERTIGGYWNLSVKASTLDKKAAYLDQFVAAVDSAHLTGHDALIFPTPDNDVEQNIGVLRNLQQRMREIRAMSVTSFEYQQAISQITAQEQDEATKTLDVIEGRWWLSHHPFNWDWIGFGLGGVLLIAAIVAWVFSFSTMDN